jgi:putative flavoprotein involved in K+ transport
VAYYDSLTLFSPSAYSSMPGAPFGGDPDHYPARDEVVADLERYAESLDVEVRTNTAVATVETNGPGFVVHTTDGETLAAAGLVAASGSFSNPHVPALPGQETFTGEALHVAAYRAPESYAGQRVVVVGAGNSAVQVGHELGELAT